MLNVLVRHDISSSHFRYLNKASESEAQELDLVRDNITRLIGRFSDRFNAYQDLTRPLVSLLRCLQVGLSLSTSLLFGSSTDNGDCSSLIQATPFLNGTVWVAESQELSPRSFEFLSLVQSIVAVDGLSNLSPFVRRGLFDSLSFFYDEWSKKMEADRKAEESMTSLYRFREVLKMKKEFDQERI